MKKGWTLTQEAFDLMLGWLSPDKDEAGVIYEQIRSGLVKLFLIRGCSNPEALTDETINRVISKLPTLISRYRGKPIHYFYRVSNKIYLESLSPRQRKEEQLDTASHSKSFAASTSPPDTNIRLDYLMGCLQDLSAEDRDLIIQYYAVDKSAKFEHRRKLAEKLGLNLNSLRIKVLRLKKKLHECVRKKMTVDT